MSRSVALTGNQVDVHIDPDWTGCSARCGGPAWTSQGSGVSSSTGRVAAIRDHRRLVHRRSFEAFLAEAMPIVESFEFDLSNRSGALTARGSLA